MIGMETISWWYHIVCGMILMVSVSLLLAMSAATLFENILLRLLAFNLVSILWITLYWRMFNAML